jgi:hypothetical protein
MCKVASFRQRPPHNTFTMLQQGIEIVDQRLHLGWICSFDPVAGTIAQTRQLLTQTAEGQKSGTELPDSCEYAERGKNQKQSDAPSRHEAELPVHRHEQQMHYGD